MSVTIPETSYRFVTQGERFKISLVSIWRRTRAAWRIYSHNWLAVLGLLLLLVYFLMAIASPILLRTVWPKTIYDPVVGHDATIFPHPTSPSSRHLLGTDTLGRDVLSALMAATMPSLQMALTAAFTAAAIGTLIGAVSAYFRGVVDGFFSHLADLSLLAPAPIVMVVIGFMLDIAPFRFGLLYGVLVGIGGVAIVLRAHAMTIMSKSFIDAARMAGGGPFHIITRHVIPHMLPLAAVNMLLTVTGAIFANGFIAFLGLSRAQLNWGSMIYDTFTYQQINGIIAWNVLIPSALAISLFAASFYFIALGLHDVAEPRVAERLAPVPRRKAEKPHKLPPVARPEPRIAEAPAPEMPGPAVAIPGGASSMVESAAVAGLASAQALPLVESTPAFGLYVQQQQSEIHQVAVLVANLRNDSLPFEGGSQDEAEGALLDPLSDMDSDLTQRGGLVELLNDGSLVASFGLTQHMPPQACALLAARASLNLKDSVEQVNHRRANHGLSALKLAIGISTGHVTIQLPEKSIQVATVLAADPGLVARTLGSFAGYMRYGGVLICENTFNYLAAVRHHFVFGRQGMAKLPAGNGQGMVYELVECSLLVD